MAEKTVIKSSIVKLTVYSDGTIKTEEPTEEEFKCNVSTCKLPEDLKEISLATSDKFRVRVQSKITKKSCCEKTEFKIYVPLHTMKYLKESSACRGGFRAGPVILDVSDSSKLRTWNSVPNLQFGANLGGKTLDLINDFDCSTDMKFSEQLIIDTKKSLVLLGKAAQNEYESLDSTTSSNPEFNDWE